MLEGEKVGRCQECGCCCTCRCSAPNSQGERQTDQFNSSSSCTACRQACLPQPVGGRHSRDRRGDQGLEGRLCPRRRPPLKRALDSLGRAGGCWRERRRCVVADGGRRPVWLREIDHEACVHLVDLSADGLSLRRLAEGRKSSRDRRESSSCALDSLHSSRYLAVGNAQEKGQSNGRRMSELG
jgi:hypothetical protein